MVKKVWTLYANKLNCRFDNSCENYNCIFNYRKPKDDIEPNEDEEEQNERFFIPQFTPFITSNSVIYSCHHYKGEDPREQYEQRKRMSAKIAEKFYPPAEKESVAIPVDITTKDK